MKVEDLISTEDLCVRYQVEQQFIRALDDKGIIEIKRVEHREYILLDQINEFERMRRFYYELHLNMESLEVVRHLLDKIEGLQLEKQRLLNRLRRYE